jgi:hypothetical protein
MKNLLVLPLFLFFLSRLSAQTWDRFNTVASVNALYQERLISPAEKDSLMRWLRNPDPNRQTAIFNMLQYDPASQEGLLMQLSSFRSDSTFLLIHDSHDVSSRELPFEEFCLVRQIQYYNAFLYGSPAPRASFFDSHGSEPLADSLSQRFLAAASALQRCGLISPEMAASPEQYSSPLTNLSDLFAAFAARVRMEKLYPQIRAAEIQKARSLVEAGIMHVDGFKHLQLDYTAGEIKGDFGMLSYCRYACLIQPDQLSPEEPEWIRQIVEKLGDQLPERGVSRIAVTRERIDYPDYVPDVAYETDHYVISLEYKGQTYSQAFAFPADSPPLANLAQTGFYEVFNKLLAETGSDYRLHNVESYNPDGIPDRAIMGLVYLTETQWRTWDEMYSADTVLSEFVTYRSLSTERFDESQSPSRITGIFAELESVGLLDHLGANEKKALLTLVLKTNITHGGSVLLLVPGIIYPIPYYLTDTSETPYAVILNDLAVCSRGAFAPSRIRDGYPAAQEGHDFKLICKLKNKFSATLSRNMATVDQALFYALASFIEKTGSASRLNSINNDSCLIWLTDAQYQTVLRNCSDLFGSDQ